MKKIIFIFFVFISHLLKADSIYRRPLFLMGCDFSITVVAKDSVEANKYIDIAIEEMSRIEKLISSWDPNSETSAINKNAGIKPVKVSQELYGLIQRSLNLSKLTDGAFDITFASMNKIWKFDGSMTNLPSKGDVNASVKFVGYHQIELNPEQHTVFLKQKKSKIGFGAIGKGYAADKAKQLLMSLGVKAGIINASGDMNTWGKQPNGSSWKVAITNPLNKNKAFATLPLKNNAVVTSGDYEKYIEFNGERYAHIINPKTGYPTKGIISVTVFAPKAELADALATSVFVMGQETGLDRINQLPGIECILVTSEGKILTSDNININTKRSIVPNTRD